jgi:hypothetical protein
MAKRLNRFDKEVQEKAIVTTSEPKEIIEEKPLVEEVKEPDISFEDTAELPIISEEDYVPQEENLKRKIDIKMHIIVALFFLIVVGCLLCGYFLYKQMKEPTSSNNTNITETINEFSNDDKLKMVDAVDTYLQDIYGGNFVSLNVDEFEATGSKESVTLNDYKVPLTSADNSPTLSTRFQLVLSENGTYEVVDYTILSAEYPETQEIEE